MMCWKVTIDTIKLSVTQRTDYYYAPKGLKIHYLTWQFNGVNKDMIVIFILLLTWSHAYTCLTWQLLLQNANGKRILC